MGWRGRWERGSGWGTHVNPWLIHVNIWQKPLQYFKVISLQLIKINEKKDANEFIYKSEPDLSIKNKRMVTKEEMGRGWMIGVWGEHTHIMYNRHVANKDPVCSTRHSSQ